MPVERTRNSVPAGGGSSRDDALEVCRQRALAEVRQRRSDFRFICVLELIVVLVGGFFVICCVVYYVPQTLADDLRDEEGAVAPAVAIVPLSIAVFISIAVGLILYLLNRLKGDEACHSKALNALYSASTREQMNAAFDDWRAWLLLRQSSTQAPEPKQLVRLTKWATAILAVVLAWFGIHDNH